MLPEEPLRKLVASHHHMHQALDQATATPPPQQSQDLVVDSHEEAVASPAAPSSAVSSQQDDDLQLVTDAAADLVAVEAPDHVSESGSEQEHDLAMSAAEESVLGKPVVTWILCKHDAYPCSCHEICHRQLFTHPRSTLIARLFVKPVMVMLCCVEQSLHLPCC